MLVKNCWIGFRYFFFLADDFQVFLKVSPLEVSEDESLDTKKILVSKSCMKEGGGMVSGGREILSTAKATA